jgi:hypothetical protein
VIGVAIPIERTFPHVTFAAADDFAGVATAVATIARTATVAATAIKEIRFNIQFPPLGLPTIRRRAGPPVGRSGESGARW